MRGRVTAVVLVLLLTVGLVGCLTTRHKPPRRTPYVERVLEVTGYCKCGECCGWKRKWYGKPVIADGPHKGTRKQVGFTASGTKAKKGTIAADTNYYPFGTLLFIPGYGYGRVEDRGSAIKGQKLDLYFRTHKQALKWGRQKVKVRIYKPKG